MCLIRNQSILLTVACLLGYQSLAFGQDSPNAASTKHSAPIGKPFFQPATRNFDQRFSDTAGFALEVDASESPDEEPIETDRHDFTQSPRTVGRRVLQLEYGFLYTQKTTERERENSYGTPELVVRYGLTERIELKARWNYAWKFYDGEDDSDSAEDIRFAVKFETSDQCGYHPDSAVEFRFTTPTGGSDFTTGRVEAGLDAVYGWDIGEYFNLAGSTGFGTNSLGDFAFVDSDPNPDDHYIAWSQSVALGAKLNSRSTFYFEWFGLASHGRDDEFNTSFLNFGVDYLLDPNTVIDVRIGWGLTEDSDDLFVGIGGGYRF